LAGGYINDHVNLKAAFACMGTLALVGALLSLWLLPATRDEAGLRKGRPPLRWKAIIGDRVIIGLFAFRMAYTSGIGIIWGFLPVLADAEFHLSSSQIGILVMLGVLVSGMIQAPMGYLADRLNRKMMILTGGILAGLAVFSYQWAGSHAQLFAGSILFGLGGGTAMPAVMAVAVLKGHQTEAMGSVMAVLTVAHSLGMLMGAIFAGLMMDWFNLRDAFGLGAGWMIAGLAVFLVCVRRIPINTT
jgi:DHA1 family multidrug resistance protein-like MFS transporter